MNLSLPLRLPILIAQHMPPVFTASLAKRLMDSSGIKAEEAKNGEEVLPNRIYVAPGDFHMAVEKKGTQVYISLNKNPQRNSVRPAVDVLFESAAEVYGYRTLGIVLTGMGEDGLVGSKVIKQKGGGILIQDQASCVVFGMPGSVFQAGYHDEIGNLASINQLLRKLSG
jgi:two-component system chemotaxis response regulator CheB